MSDFQVFDGDEEDHIHNKCHREPEQYIQEIKSSEKRIPEFQGSAQISISFNDADHREMDATGSRLGQRIWRVLHNVRRPYRQLMFPENRAGQLFQRLTGLDIR